MWPEKESNPEATKRTRNEGSRSCKKQGMLFAGLEPVPHDKTIDPPPNTCINCWSSEHKRIVCPHPKVHDYCCNCGRKGLTVEECPRCAKAFQAQKSEYKKWVYAKFFDSGVNQSGAHKMQMASKKTDGRCKDDAEDWDDYGDSYYQSQAGGTAAIGDKFNELDHQDFDWEPSYQSNATAIAESNELFTYMRDKKIRDQFQRDRINNPEGNVDETSMVEKNFVGENSNNSLKKNELNEPVRGMGEPLRDFLNLLDAMKHLSVKTQDVVVLQFMSERKKQMAEKGGRD